MNPDLILKAKKQVDNIEILRNFIALFEILSKKEEKNDFNISATLVPICEGIVMNFQNNHEAIACMMILEQRISDLENLKGEKKDGCCNSENSGS